MPKFTRREILRALAAVGLSQAFWPFGPRGLVFGAESAKAVLVVVHLRGGCDGLNLISPANDPNFIAARASDLRVASEGKDAGYPLGSTPAANIDFRLHPAGAGLFELYKSGNLAFVHACGFSFSECPIFI